MGRAAAKGEFGRLAVSVVDGAMGESCRPGEAELAGWLVVANWHVGNTSPSLPGGQAVRNALASSSAEPPLLSGRMSDRPEKSTTTKGTLAALTLAILASESAPLPLT